jgi:hypothetical protein
LLKEEQQKKETENGVRRSGIRGKETEEEVKKHYKQSAKGEEECESKE